MKKKDVINEIIDLYDEVQKLREELEPDFIHREFYRVGRESIWQEYGAREYCTDSVISWDNEVMSFSRWFDCWYGVLPPFMSKNQFKKEFGRELRERYEQKLKEAEADGEPE